MLTLKYKLLTNQIVGKYIILLDYDDKTKRLLYELGACSLK